MGYVTPTNSHRHRLRLDAEANRQAEFYHACRLIALPVVLELTTTAGRLDAAIMSPDRKAIVAIVEVKRRRRDFENGLSAQIMRYKRLGLPVYGLSFANDPHRLAATIQKRHANEPGVTLVALAQMDRMTKKMGTPTTADRIERMDEDLNVKVSPEY